MIPPPRIKDWLVLCLAALLTVGCRVSTQAREAMDAWSEVPKILQRIVPPTFPERDFDVIKFGAVGDGRATNTMAFQAAIAACTKAGGGRVIVPPGKFYTGPIRLRSGVNLHLSEDAEIIFSDTLEDYLPVVLVR